MIQEILNNYNIHDTNEHKRTQTNTSSFALFRRISFSLLCLLSLLLFSREAFKFIWEHILQRLKTNKLLCVYEFVNKLIGDGCAFLFDNNRCDSLVKIFQKFIGEKGRDSGSSGAHG